MLNALRTIGCAQSAEYSSAHFAKRAPVRSAKPRKYWAYADFTFTPHTPHFVQSTEKRANPVTTRLRTPRHSAPLKGGKTAAERRRSSPLGLHLVGNVTFVFPQGRAR